jgi:CheY-like chemotaxis protein/DNA-binding CsgD family transcriptional regulator
MGLAKILIADDEPLNIKLYSVMLSKMEYMIITANNGFDAVKLAREELPDLIVLDWNMPRQNGLESLKILKHEEKTKNIPVIMITGIMTTPENLGQAFKEGAIDFLRKPFDKIELKARVKSMLLLSNAMKVLQEKYYETESNNKFIYSLINTISHPLVYYTIDGIIIGYNRHFEQMAGMNAGALNGTLIYRHCFGEHSAIHLNRDLELIQHQGEITYEGKMRDGQEFLFSKNLFEDANGVKQGILCVMTNLTSMKKVYTEVMENKKRELVSSALRLIQVNELNNQLIAELGSLNAYTNKEGSEKIRNIVRQYSSKTGEGFWKDFEARFEHVYEVFYKRLMDMFPELTPGERKLCALLRLNVSSKDIAIVTSQNPQSVDMARYRLRKKLNLNPEENLVDFLMKIDT